MALALKGNEIAEPADIIRDPYVFEFLGLPEDKPVMESDLEWALVQQIEKFLLELTVALCSSARSSVSLSTTPTIM